MQPGPGKLRVFYLSENDVKKQIWIAIATDITKKRLHLDHHNLLEVLNILSPSMFESISENQVLTPPTPDSDKKYSSSQLAVH